MDNCAASFDYGIALPTEIITLPCQLLHCQVGLSHYTAIWDCVIALPIRINELHCQLRLLHYTASLVYCTALQTGTTSLQLGLLHFTASWDYCTALPSRTTSLYCQLGLLHFTASYDYGIILPNCTTKYSTVKWNNHTALPAGIVLLHYQLEFFTLHCQHCTANLDYRTALLAGITALHQQLANWDHCTANWDHFIASLDEGIALPTRTTRIITLRCHYCSASWVTTPHCHLRLQHCTTNCDYYTALPSGITALHCQLG